MFEYWFHGLDDGHGTFTHHGTTHDFLEVVSQMAMLYDAEIASKFLKNFLVAFEKELSFLRVTDWKFEYAADDGVTIVLHKLK